jgi:hypothetical protein
MQLSLASPAESGITSTFGSLCISTTEIIRLGDRLYLQQFPLLLRPVQQENNHTHCDVYSSILKTLGGKLYGTQDYSSLGMAIHINTAIQIPNNQKSQPYIQH